VARTPHASYLDPLSEIWLIAAQRIGLRIDRSDQVFASTDGRGRLTIGTPSTLDPDDSLAQMIFHELCHSLIEGPGSFARPDWGMDNVTAADEWREHACLRLQWVLSGRFGLRGLLAPTTDFRAFWDALPDDPLAERSLLSVQAAIRGLERVERSPWFPALPEALAATQTVAKALLVFVGDGVPPSELATSLWRSVVPPPANHPTGLPMATSDPDRRCGDCAWQYHGGPGKRRARCRQASGAPVEPAWAGCERWEVTPDCQSCGACCRSAYQSVEVGRRDPFRKAHPDHVVDRGSYLEVRRQGDRCAALHGGDIEGGRVTTAYHCVVYDDRPRTCRDFTLGSDHCLTARRRVGLSL
jgi:hypothetical protein